MFNITKSFKVIVSIFKGRIRVFEVGLHECVTQNKPFKIQNLRRLLQRSYRVSKCDITGYLGTCSSHVCGDKKEILWERLQLFCGHQNKYFKLKHVFQTLIKWSESLKPVQSISTAL